jgi:hypothetical protein
MFHGFILLSIVYGFHRVLFGTFAICPLDAAGMKKFRLAGKHPNKSKNEPYPDYSGREREPLQ